MSLLLLKKITFSLTNAFIDRYKRLMAGVAQLVRAPGCGPGGRRFETGHSPHLYIYVLLLIFSFGPSHAEESNSGERKPVDFSGQISALDKVINNKIPLQAKYQIPHMTVIVDQFGMREDISNKILATLSPRAILCVPFYCIAPEKYIIKAKELGFNLAISADRLSEEQWIKLQEIIEKNPWIKGVVIWSLPTESNLNEFLSKIKEWLGYRGIWLVYANTNNILANPEVPIGVFMPDGFVRTTDENMHVTEQAEFVLDQAKCKNRGLLLIEPGIQHISLFIDWVGDHINSFQLDNWAEHSLPTSKPHKDSKPKMENVKKTQPTKHNNINNPKIKNAPIK